ncbi:MAG TPA: glycosyltransferase family A protein, partial [Mycobacteriales bacterium]|nr:glycosyltransferase family A protein [Mycobacteriales bacterium]
MTAPRASILVPTHNKATTLPLAVDSALRQTVADLEVIVIGDGVTDDVRVVGKELAARDSRVRFLDLAKGPHHGECYRHDAIVDARSNAIFYLCDDDLLLPEHVEDLLTLLAEHQFAQSFNAFVRPDGSIGFYACDLSRPESVRLMLRDDLRYNAVSITGTAHRRDAYLALNDPWDTTPEGAWPDHHQWRKFFRQPGFTGATSDRVTALQFPTSADGRDRWSPEQRLAELSRWHDVVTSAGAQDVVDARVLTGLRADLVMLREAHAVVRWRLARDEAKLKRIRAQRRARRDAQAARLEANRKARSLRRLFRRGDSPPARRSAV